MKRAKNFFIFSFLSLLKYMDVYKRLSVDSYINWKYNIFDFSIYGLINFYLDLMPMFILFFLFGNYIYKHFIYSSPYYMVRHTDRKRWLLSQEVALFKEISYCWLAYYSIFLILAIAYYGISKNIILGIVVQFTLDIMFSYLFCLLMNILSIKMGSHYSFIISYSLVIISVGIINLNESVLLIDSMIGYIFLLVNPVANLVLNFHLKLNGNLNLMSIGEMIPFCFSILYYSVLTMLLIQIGKVIVANHNMLPKEER